MGNRRTRYKVRGELGSGERFKRLTSTLRAKGAYNPAALAAHIGMKKYGRKKMSKMAQAGK